MAATVPIIADNNLTLPLAFDDVVCNVCYVDPDWHKGVDLMAGVGTPFYSIADAGSVEVYYSAMGGYGGWPNVPGKMLLVRYQKSDGHYYYVQYGHVTNVPSSYQSHGATVVKVGAHLGDIANYNPCLGGGAACPHMHFGIWDYDDPPPTSGYGYGSDLQHWVDPLTFIATNDIDVGKSTALNDRNEYAVSQSPNQWFGGTAGSIGWYHSYDPDALYESGTNTAVNCYRTVYGGGSYAGAVVYDALGGARHAYCVGDQEWATWDNLEVECSGNCPTPTCSDGQPGSGEGGPNSALGMPITNRYNYPENSDHWRQDFQKGYIQDGTTVKCNTTTTPGWTSSGWNNQYSYLFADAYDRNGARRDVGNPISGNNGLVHVLSGNILIQDFSNGNDQAGMIMYDLENWDGNECATNEAYWVYGSIKTYYDNNGGVSTFGCATIDRFSYDGHWCQDFKKGNEFWRIRDDGVCYPINPCRYDGYHVGGGQSGSDLIPLVGHFNTDGMEDIGLYEASTGRWFVAANSGSSFSQISGPYTYNSWLDDWGTGSGFTPLVGDFTGDGKADICVYRPEYGRWYVARNDGDRFTQVDGPYTENSWLTGWKSGSGYVPLVGDFNDDGKADIAVYQAQYGRWYVAFNNYGSSNTFSQADGTHTDNAWEDDWGTGSGLTPLVGDFNGDGKTDIGLYEAVNGRWFVGFNDYGTANRFVQANGTYIYQSWYTDWGKGSGYVPLIGDFNNDGKSDIGVYQAQYGYWFIAYNNYGSSNSFDQASGTHIYESWLDDWGTGSGLTPLVGNFSSGPHDIGLYEPANGRWFVAFNNYGTAQSFSQANGPYYAYAWYDDWGKESGGQGKIASLDNQETGALPVAFSLSQNYPNPFNPATTVSYTLPISSLVTLEVYNTLGQKVATLVNEFQQAGEHTAQWDCSQCASGVYFYRLRSGESSQVRKMILLK